MAYVKQLKDADTGNAIFPITHIDAVIDGNGNNVGDLIDNKLNKPIELTNYEELIEALADSSLSNPTDLTGTALSLWNDLKSKYNSNYTFTIEGNAAFIDAYLVSDMIFNVPPSAESRTGFYWHFGRVNTKYYYEDKSILFLQLLVSGTNIKTINTKSLVGSGDIAINGGTLAYTGADLYDTVTGGTVDDEIDALDAMKAREVTFTKKAGSTSITFTTSSQVYGRQVYCLSANATTWQAINSLTFNTGSFNTVLWTQITPAIGGTLPAVGDKVSEYYFIFFAGINDMPITFPSNIKWENGEKPTIKANDFCELVIRNGIASLRRTVIQ